MSRSARLLALLERREQARRARCAAALREAEAAQAAAEARQARMHALLAETAATRSGVQGAADLRALHDVARALSEYRVRSAREAEATAARVADARADLGQAHAQVKALGARREAAERAARAEAEARAERKSPPPPRRGWHDSCE
ncbi:hypothetical protein [Rhodosalinus sediminis]|uniref:hypothetical protein n=1 Tax=Rhodosalinus sediminis TaxID=1940533 RepID=UPI002356CE59|nr:hypothetical protein [Rhodosalinus sediminis]